MSVRPPFLPLILALCGALTWPAASQADSATVPTARFASSILYVPAYPEGELSKQRLTTDLSPLAADVGSSASVFVVVILPAALGGSMFCLLADGSFQAYDPGQGFASYFSGSLPAKLSIPVIATPLDLTALSGTQVWVGYGKGSGAAAVSDMLARETYDWAHQIGK